MRRATAEELARWDELVAGNPDGGNVLQAKVYGEFKAAYGWRPEYIIHQLVDVRVATLYLVRSVTGLGELWYAPKGPGVSSTAQLRALLHDFVAPQAFMLKIEPDLAAQNTSLAALQDMGLVKAKYDLQWNRNTVVVDLRPSEDEILASFKQKTRYNIRLAERKGVEIHPVELTVANIQQMYELMLAVQERAGFYMRSREYLERFWRLHSDAGRGQLFFATFEGELVAGVFALYLGKQGLYKDGGSTRTHPDLQAPYLLQWEIMRWLKSKDCLEYDLHGTPPHDRLEDRTHPLAGLAQFKTGFNPGTLTEYIGVYDLPLKPTRYKFWHRAGEKLVAGYSFKVKKELFY